MEQTEGNAARLFDGLIAARQGEWAPVGDALDGIPRDEEEFAAPNGAVEAEAGAVPRDAESGRRDFVFRQAREDVGKMVLDADVARAAQFAGIAGREIIGVQVRHDDVRFGGVKILEIGDDAVKGRVGGLGIQIADVLADENSRADGEGDGVFQVRADGENRFGSGMAEFRFESDRERRVAPGPAQDHLAVEQDAHDGVVNVAEDGAVVDEEEVGDAAQMNEGLVFIGADGFVGQIAAGGDDGESEIGEEQMMERSRGQHDAEVRIGRGDGSGDVERGRKLGRKTAEQGDGSLRGAEQAFLEGRDAADGLDGIERGKHEGERLFLAVLAAAQAVDGDIVAGVHQEMEPTQALGGDDETAPDGFGGGAQGVIAGGQDEAGGTPELETGAASGTGVGLGMETAVAGVVEFGLAQRTEWEAVHGSVGAVVREGLDDAEAWAAMGAIGEGIAETAIGRIEDFAQAIGTGGDVGQHESGRLTGGVAGADDKALAAEGIEPGSFEALDGTEGRLPGFEAKQESIERAGVALGFEEDALWGIVDPAGEGEFGGEAKNEGTKADALNGAADDHAEAGAGGGFAVGIAGRV